MERIHKNVFNWLHLSDVHLPESSEDTYHADSVIRSLIQTLKTETENGEGPDLVFFTGDIASKGSDYAKAVVFFDDLLEATGLVSRYGEYAKRYLFLVPGNHDVDREQTSFLKRTLDTREEANSFFAPQSVRQRQYYFNRFHAFESFFNKYFKGIRSLSAETPYYAEVIHLDGTPIRVGVVGFISAWFSQDDHDNQKLWIGERLCNEAFDSLNQSTPIDLLFALHHHPYSWLHESESRYVRGLLTNRADICLYGHLHESETEEIKDQHGKVLRFQAGALYEKSPHRYRILCGKADCDKREVHIRPMTYQEGPPGCWALDTSLFPNRAPHYTETFSLPRLDPKSEPTQNAPRRRKKGIRDKSVTVTTDPLNDAEPSTVDWVARDLKLVEQYFEQCAKYDELYRNYSEWDERRVKEYFINNGLACTTRTGQTLLTHAGVLLCCRRDSIPQHFYNVEVILVDANNLRQQLSGCVLYLYFQILERLKPLFSSRLGSPAIRDSSGGEHVYYDYPETALIEALVNFLIHRDYRLSDVGFVTLTPEKVDFMNPGQSLFLPSVLLESKLPLRPIYQRNSRLITAMSKARLNQKEGSGILRIRESLESNLSYFPDSSLGLSITNDEQSNRFSIAIYSRFYLSPSTLSEDSPKLTQVFNNQPPKELVPPDYLSESIEGFVTRDPRMLDLIDRIKVVSATNATVLLLGETGTGKELAARAIHALSTRKDRPLVAMNCSALSESLFEADLFGYEKGAFTGAVTSRPGRIEVAEGGTLVFDEIDSLSIGLQSKLLRFLQEAEFRRVGSQRVIKTNIRIIAIANADLRALVETGGFRRDLYYRLNVIPLHLPSLRERKEDIPLLFNHFLKRNSLRYNKEVQVDRAVFDQLKEYKFPGNVRELENLVEYLFTLTKDGQIHINDLPRDMLS